MYLYYSEKIHLWCSETKQFGFLAIQKGTVLTEGSRNIERSKLIGGHSAGGLEGLK